MNNERVLQIAKVFVRLALGITFLVSIGDRLSWLGAYGSKNVSWGDWTHFVQYVAALNSFVPKNLIPGLAVLETIIELGLGIALLLGIYQRVVALEQRCVTDVVCPDHEHRPWDNRASELFGFHGGRRRTAAGRGCGAACRSEFCQNTRGSRIDDQQRPRQYSARQLGGTADARV